MEVFTGDRGLPSDVILFPDTHLTPFALPSADAFSDHHKTAIDSHHPSGFDDDFHPPPPQKLRPIRCNGRSLPECCSSDDHPHDTQPVSWCGRPSPEVGFYSTEDDGGGFISPKACLSGLSSKECQFESQLCSSSREGSELQEAIKEPVNKKRKKKSRKKLELFFQSMMRRVMEKQEEMHRELLEVLEKKEKERILREEAWKKKEIARAMMDEAAGAQEMSRCLALISYIKNSLGDDIQIPEDLETLLLDKKVGPYQNQNDKSSEECPDQNEIHENFKFETGNYREEIKFDPSDKQEEVKCDGSSDMEEPEGDLNNRRWAKSEVQALITVRAAVDQKVNVKGTKGPIWDEVAAGLFSMGYNRTPKKCKEKWENINKYYKRTMEKGKDHVAKSKVCTYFGELEMLHKHGFLGSGNAHGKDQGANGLNMDSNAVNPEKSY